MTFTLEGLGPISNPQAWDVIYIGSTPSPGVVKLTGFKRINQWDVKKGKGALGASIEYTGRYPAKGTLTFQFWTDDQIEFEWPEFSSQFQYDPTKKTITAVTVAYPSLAQIGITQIVCESIGAIVHKGAQLYEVEVEFLEYFPPPPAPAVAAPKTATTSDDTPFGPPFQAVTLEQQKQALRMQLSAIPRAGQSP